VYIVDENTLNNNCNTNVEGCSGLNVHCESSAGVQNPGTCVCNAGTLEVAGICCKCVSQII